MIPVSPNATGNFSMTTQNQVLPLTYLLSPPADLDEIRLRAELITARWLNLAGAWRELIDSHISTVQASTLSTVEQLRQSALEAAFLSSPPRAESIDIN